MAARADLNTTISAASSARSAYHALSARKPQTAPTSPAAGDKAWQAAQDFEAVFLNSMFNQMFTGIEGEGPFGGSQATGVWRSFLTDEYAKSFARKGGVGIAPHVYQSLLAQQEAGGKATAPAMEIRS
jgi:Rod binding domain-containing protein